MCTQFKEFKLKKYAWSLGENINYNQLMDVYEKAIRNAKSQQWFQVEFRS